MLRATFAAVATVLGGSLWVLHRFLGPGEEGLGAVLHWGGLALVLAAAAVAASGLVTAEVVPLRVLVALCAPLLVFSVIAFFRPQGSGWYHGLWGGIAVLVGAAGLWRHRGSLVPAPRTSRGAHAR